MAMTPADRRVALRIVAEDLRIGISLQALRTAEALRLRVERLRAGTAFG